MDRIRDWRFYYSGFPSLKETILVYLNSLVGDMRDTSKERLICVVDLMLIQSTSMWMDIIGGREEVDLVRLKFQLDMLYTIWTKEDLSIKAIRYSEGETVPIFLCRGRHLIPITSSYVFRILGIPQREMEAIGWREDQDSKSALHYILRALKR